MNHVSAIGFRHLFGSAVAAFAAATLTIIPQRAAAADVVCAPDPSGTLIANATETCTGPGDRVNYGVAPATASSAVTLSGVNISNATSDGVSVNAGDTSQTLLTSGGGSILTTGGSGINFFTTTSGTGTLSVGTATNRISIPVTGGNGAAAAQGIFVTGRGDVNVFTGAVPIVSTSTGGGSWAIRAQSASGGSGPGGAVVVDTQGALTGQRGGILATTTGTDVTDTVSVITVGTVTANAGSGIEARGINGDVSVSASGAVIGTIGVGTGGGIVVQTTGTGNGFINTLTGGTISATGAGANGITATASGAGGVTLNIGANVTSAAATGILTTATTGNTNMTIGGASAVAGTVGISAASSATGNITILSGNGATGKVTGTAGDGIFASSTSTGTVSVGTVASRFNIVSTGGNGAAAANGIRVESNGSVNVFTGAAAISSTSTAGASWGIRARSLSGGSGPGGAVTVDSQGAVSGPGGIQATTNGTDITDTVTVIASGPVTGNAGAGIQARSVNGSASVTASGAVAGSAGTAANGIDVAASGTGSVAITTLSGGTVTATGTAMGIVSSAGAGGQTVSIGANVTSANSNAIKVTNTGATGVNTVSLGSALISAPGTSSTSAIIDISSASGGLTTLNTAAGTSVLSRSATAAAQNADLAIRGAGGSVVVNHSGSLRGRVDFSGIAAPADNITFNNNSLTSWHTTGTSTFSAGNDTFNNNGLLAANGTTVLDFAGGRDVFNNNAGANLTIGETAGASIARLNNVEVFNNAGTIQLSNGETNDALVATSAAYVSSGAATISLDAALGSTVQSACTAQVADCVSLGVASGTGTRIVVNDTNATAAGVLNPAGVVLVEVAPGSTGKFTLSGSNVEMTPQGPAIVKGFVQYQLAFDPARNAVALVGAPNGSMLEPGNLIAGAENIWHVTAESWEERLAAARQRYSAPASANSPVLAQGDGGGFGAWAQVYNDQFRRDRSQSVSVFGVPQAYDTSYRQITSGVQVGADTVMRNADGTAIVAGALAGYGESHMHFNADENRANYTLWNIGLYGSYLDGPLFIDLLAKYDSLSTNFDFHGVPSLQSVHGNSVGAKLVLGETFPLMPDVFLQPIISGAYVRSTFDDLSAPGNTFSFQGGTSARATIGLRLSTDLRAGITAIQPFLFGGFGIQNAGENSTTVLSGDTTFTFFDSPFRNYGVASAGVNLFSDGPVSGFVKGVFLFASGAHSEAVWLGLKFTP